MIFEKKLIFFILNPPNFEIPNNLRKIKAKIIKQKKKLMFFYSSSIIFYFFPSLLSSTSIIIYLENKKSGDFISTNLGYLCGKIFLFIIFSIYRRKLPKKASQTLSNILTFLSLLSELAFFIFYEMQFYIYERKIDNFLIFARTTFLIIKIFAYNNLLDFKISKIFYVVGIISIFLFVYFFLNGMQIILNNILILFFQNVSFIFIVCGFSLTKKGSMEKCCKHRIFSEILMNSKLNLLAVEKKKNGWNIILTLGRFSKYYTKEAKKNIKLLENPINYLFCKFVEEPKQILKNFKVFSSKKIFSNSSKEVQILEDRKLKLHEILEHITTNSLEEKELEYPVCFKYDLDKKYLLKIKRFKLSNNQKEIFTIVISNENENEKISRLEKIVELNKRFFSSFSHELKTPINGSLPLIELVKNSILHDKRSSELLEIAIGSIKLLHNSIDNILNFYLFESDQFIINATDFSLRDFIDEIKSIILPMAMVKKIHLIFKIDKKIDSIQIHTDYEKLRQLLLNLLTNAMQFTNAGSIHLIVEIKCFFPLKLIFTVKDTGIGIDEIKLNLLKSILTEEESFFEKQINSSGSCFGLLICQRIIFLLGGEPGIQIKSRVNVGSEFSFFIDGGIMQQNNDIDISTLRNLTNTNSYIEIAIKAKLNTCLIEEKKQSNKSFSKLSHRIMRTNRTDGANQSNNVSFTNSKSHNEIKLKMHHAHNFDKPINFDRIKKNERLENSEGVDSDVIINYFKRENSSDSSVKSLVSKKDLSFEFYKKKCDCNDILVVDDDAFNLLSMEIILKSFNFKCLKATSGMEAIEKLKKQHYSCDCKCMGIKLILMDYQMPIMDGLQTSTEIINLINKKEINNIPIIGCTAFISKDQIMACLEIGMKDVIFKPITRNVIKHIIEEWIT